MRRQVRLPGRLQRIHRLVLLHGLKGVVEGSFAISIGDDEGGSPVVQKAPSDLCCQRRTQKTQLRNSAQGRVLREGKGRRKGASQSPAQAMAILAQTDEA